MVSTVAITHPRHAGGNPPHRSTEQHYHRTGNTNQPVDKRGCPGRHRERLAVRPPVSTRPTAVVQRQSHRMHPDPVARSRECWHTSTRRWQSGPPTRHQKRCQIALSAQMTPSERGPIDPARTRISAERVPGPLCRAGHSAVSRGGTYQRLHAMKTDSFRAAIVPAIRAHRALDAPAPFTPAANRTPSAHRRSHRIAGPYSPLERRDSRHFPTGDRVSPLQPIHRRSAPRAPGIPRGIVALPQLIRLRKDSTSSE